MIGHKWFWIPAIVVVSFCFVAFPLMRQQAESEWESKRNEGRRAQLVGVPAEANPYIGDSSVAARLWLDGWIEAKEQQGAGQ